MNDRKMKGIKIMGKKYLILEPGAIGNMIKKYSAP
jgi:hypothetical protein